MQFGYVFHFLFIKMISRRRDIDMINKKFSATIFANSKVFIWTRKYSTYKTLPTLLPTPKSTYQVLLTGSYISRDIHVHVYEGHHITQPNSRTTNNKFQNNNIKSWSKRKVFHDGPCAKPKSWKDPLLGEYFHFM